ncbi:MAG: hypothetical protein HC854_02490 [Flavobacterium sp.]|nr:hypothetical protein [Flavobacterium sp.]
MKYIIYFFSLLLFQSCIAQKQDRSFILKTKTDKTILELDKNGVVLSEGNPIASLTENNIILDLKGDTLAYLHKDDILILKNKNQITKILPNGTIDNGSGQSLKWNKKGYFKLNNKEQLQIIPNNSKLYRGASLLITMQFMIASEPYSNTELILSNQPMTNENHFPRIEVYTEKDYGDKNAGSQTTTNSNEKVYGMGKADYQPHINRTSYLLDEKEAFNLMNVVLIPLNRCFKDNKPNTTLENYFTLSLNRELVAFRNLLPNSLTGFLSYDYNNERQFFETIIEYQKIAPRSIEIVWLDEKQWFVNNVFYQTDLSQFYLDKEPNIDEKLTRGTLIDFIRFSNVIQPKLNEGFSHLKIQPEQSEIPTKNILLELALTPGGPGSSSYQYVLNSDGTLKNLNKSIKIPHYQIVSLLNELQSIYIQPIEKSLKARPKVADDGQSLIFKVWKDGKLINLQYEGVENPMPKNLEAFYNKTVAFFRKSMEN